MSWKNFLKQTNKMNVNDKKQKQNWVEKIWLCTTDGSIMSIVVTWIKTTATNIS